MRRVWGSGSTTANDFGSSSWALATIVNPSRVQTIYCRSILHPNLRCHICRALFLHPDAVLAAAVVVAAGADRFVAFLAVEGLGTRIAFLDHQDDVALGEGVLQFAEEAGGDTLAA